MLLSWFCSLHHHLCGPNGQWLHGTLGQLPRIRRPHLTNMYVSQYRGIKLISLPCKLHGPFLKIMTVKIFNVAFYNHTSFSIPSTHTASCRVSSYLPPTNNDECTSVHSFYLKPSWITTSSIQPTQPAS